MKLRKRTFSFKVPNLYHKKRTQELIFGTLLKVLKKRKAIKSKTISLKRKAKTNMFR
jgi:hypothetical protein